MSLHIELVSYALSLEKLVDSVDVTEIKKTHTECDNFKIQTNIDVRDFDLMQSILMNNSLGFESREALMDFKNKGDIEFNYVGETVTIHFLNGYSVDEAVLFADNLCKKYSEAKNISSSKSDGEKKIVNGIGSIKVMDEKGEEIWTGESEVRVKTNMRDVELIKSVMDDEYLHLNPEEELDKGHVVLNLNEDGTCDLIFTGDYDENQIKNYVEKLTDAYKSRLQEITYEKVMAKIREKNYSLESEEIDDDNSITLTLNI